MSGKFKKGREIFFSSPLTTRERPGVRWTTATRSSLWPYQKRCGNFYIINGPTGIQLISTYMGPPLNDHQTEENRTTPGDRCRLA